MKEWFPLSRYMCSPKLPGAVVRSMASMSSRVVAFGTHGSFCTQERKMRFFGYDGSGFYAWELAGLGGG